MGIRPRPRQLFVRRLPGDRSRGIVLIGPHALPCVLGRSGIAALKREGDGATPLGTFTLRRVLFRPDRLGRPPTALPLDPIHPYDGWCDAPEDRNYNRSVRHPYAASAENLWRDDALYDLVVILSHNERPRIRYRGSAVFMHLARDGFTPTAGCIALRRRDFLNLLPLLTPGTRLHICN